MAKLVRDRIPQIMLDKGGDPHISFAKTDDEYLKLLKDKLREEAAEYAGSGKPEELADILEVVEAICRLKGYRKMDIEAIKNSKAMERGKFDKRIILE